MSNLTTELRKELEDSTKKMSDILSSASISLDIVETLAQVMSSNYKEVVLNNHYYFYTFFTQFRISVIELYKLFSNSTNDKYRLRSFIADLKSNRKFAGLNVPGAKITQWEQDFKSHSNLIQHLGDLRNKVYAHTDHSEVEAQATFQDIRILIGIAVDILDEVHGKLFGTGFSLTLLMTAKIDLKNVLKLSTDRIDDIDGYLSQLD